MKFVVKSKQLPWKPAVLLLPQTRLAGAQHQKTGLGGKRMSPRQRSLRHLHGHCVLCYTVELLLFVILPVNKRDDVLI